MKTRLALRKRVYSERKKTPGVYWLGVLETRILGGELQDYPAQY